MKPQPARARRSDGGTAAHQPPTSRPLEPPYQHGGLVLSVICFVYISCYFNLVYSYNTHLVLVGLPQRVGGLAIYFISVYFYNTQVLVGLPQGVGGLAILFILYQFVSVYFYNTHRVLVTLPQGVGGLAISIYFII
jgi:hypothetical protein